MAESIIISTPHLKVEPFSEKHLSERYVGWLNDPEVTRFSDQRHRRHTLESCREYLESFRNSPNYFWAIIANDPAFGHIGNLNAYVDAHHSVADVGIIIGETLVHGQGIASEAWIGVCDYLLRVAGVRKVTAGTTSVNIPMLKLMRRTGMAEDGRRPRQCLLNGRAVDVIYAALFREQWLKKFPDGPFAID